jgi:hypothetical protein
MHARRPDLTRAASHAGIFGDAAGDDPHFDSGALDMSDDSRSRLKNLSSARARAILSKTWACIENCALLVFTRFERQSLQCISAAFEGLAGARLFDSRVVPRVDKASRSLARKKNECTFVIVPAGRLETRANAGD